MAHEVLMPQMGESIAEGTITKWLVKQGDQVERDQPLFEISTDKVDAEIPSPESGVLIEIKRQEGDTVPVNEVVALIGEAGEAAAAGEEPAAKDGAPEAAPAAREEREAAPAARQEEPAPRPEAEPEGAPAPDRAGAEEAPAEEAERVRRFSSPVVRKMASEHGVDLERVEGTGIHGRVTKRDLEAYLEAGGEEEAAAPPPVQPETRPAVRQAELVTPVRRDPGEFSVPAFRDGEDVDVEPMSKIRQLTAAHMIYSKATSAHVTTVFQMDLSRVARARARAKSGFARAHGTKLTFMPFIFKAVASALKGNRKLNAAVDGTNIVYKKNIHIGMAVALDWGLIVPVIKHADQLNLVGLAKAANDLADRARGKKLSPDEVQGGTFTVTNPGVFGSMIGTPIINQPQVAILGIGVIEKRPVVETDDEGIDSIGIRTMSYFSISYDHRLVDGADADHFMIDVKRVLENDPWSELEPFG